jgi:hypothetical protein
VLGRLCQLPFIPIWHPARAVGGPAGADIKTMIRSFLTTLETRMVDRALAARGARVTLRLGTCGSVMWGDVEQTAYYGWRGTLPGWEFTAPNADDRGHW